MCTFILLSSSTPTSFHVKPFSQYQYHRRRALFADPASNLAISAPKNSIFFLGCQSLIHLSHGVQRKHIRSKRNFAVYNSVQPGVPLPSEPPSSGSWKGWIVGIVLTCVLPFLANKWGPLLKIKNKVDAAVQMVEDVVDAAEKVAETVEKVAEDIVDDLPAGKLKDAVNYIENVADRIDDATEVIGDVIDKAQEVEEQVESAVESALDDKKQAVDDEAKEPAKEVKAED